MLAYLLRPSTDFRQQSRTLFTHAALTEHWYREDQCCIHIPIGMQPCLSIVYCLYVLYAAYSVPRYISCTTSEYCNMNLHKRGRSVLAYCHFSGERQQASVCLEALLYSVVRNPPPPCP